jgi:hypothetical protein
MPGTVQHVKVSNSEGLVREADVTAVPDELAWI